MATSTTVVTASTNPPTIQLANDSMFQLTPVYKNPADGNLVLGLRIQYVPQLGDRLVNVTMATDGRPDTLSSWYQSDPALWWLMADLTQLVDPLLDFEAGLQVRFSPTGLNR